MIKDKYVIPVLEALSIKHGIATSEIEKVHDSCFKFIAATIQEIPFRDMAPEEFIETKKIFNIPGLGKMYPSEKLFNRLYKIRKNGEKEES